MAELTNTFLTPFRQGNVEMEIMVKFGEAYHRYNLGEYEKAFKLWYSLAKDKMFLNACYNVGIMYILGEGISQDYDKAKEFFRLAGDQGHTKSQYNYATILEKIDRNEEEAFIWYQKAAKAGLPEARCRARIISKKHRLGVMYKKWQEAKKDPELAFKWCKKAAEHGHIECQRITAFCYKNGIGVEPDGKKSARWFYCAAMNGDSESQYEIGVIYEEGKILYNKYPEKAVEFYKKSAEQGFAAAQYKLGIMYKNGWGVAKSEKEAFDLFEKAAAQGDVFAMFQLATMYDKGQVVDKNKEQAFHWCKKSADSGYHKAQLILAHMYSLGKQYVKKNDDLAIKYYTLAARQGNDTARQEIDEKYPGEYCSIIDLGSNDENGRMVGGDEKQATWYRRSADKGHHPAQLELARMYSLGQGGVEKNDKLAIKYYILAARQGNDEAIQELEEKYANKHTFEEKNDATTNNEIEQE